MATLYYVNQFVSNPIFQIIAYLGSLTFGLGGLLVAINRGMIYMEGLSCAHYQVSEVEQLEILL